MKDYIVTTRYEGGFLVTIPEELKETKKRRIIARKKGKDIRGLYFLLVGDNVDFFKEHKRIIVSNNGQDSRYFLPKNVRESLRDYQPKRKNKLNQHAEIAKEKGLYGKTKLKERIVSYIPPPPQKVSQE